MNACPSSRNENLLAGRPRIAAMVSTITASEIASMTPGVTPAKNSLVIDCSVRTP